MKNVLFLDSIQILVVISRRNAIHIKLLAFYYLSEQFALIGCPKVTVSLV